MGGLRRIDKIHGWKLIERKVGGNLEFCQKATKLDFRDFVEKKKTFVGLLRFFAKPLC
jgi:hypothetical protein